MRCIGAWGSGRPRSTGAARLGRLAAAMCRSCPASDDSKLTPAPTPPEYPLSGASHEHAAASASATGERPAHMVRSLSSTTRSCNPSVSETRSTTRTPAASIAHLRSTRRHLSAKPELCVGIRLRVRRGGLATEESSLQGEAVPCRRPECDTTIVPCPTWSVTSRGGTWAPRRHRKEGDPDGYE